MQGVMSAGHNKEELKEEPDFRNFTVNEEEHEYDEENNVETG